MTAKARSLRLYSVFTRTSGFTLLELLVVVAILGLLSALLLPALVRGKSQAQNAACKSRLHQLGLALAMYASDTSRYPPIHDWDSGQFWMDKIRSYHPLPWTNTSWNCPSYMAKGGLAVFWATNKIEPRNGARWWISYAYNNNGILGGGWPGWDDTPVFSLRGRLGLGGLPRLVASDREVAQPSQMYAVADARSYRRGSGTGWFPIEPVNASLGLPSMTPWRDVWFWDTSVSALQEIGPQHRSGYNVVFCDAHVEGVKRSAFLSAPRSAQHWNRDNQPHEEAWAPPAHWAPAD